MGTFPQEKLVTVPEAVEQLDIVVVGHVDHGKSTLIGRLLADTGSLPQGKLEEVRERCRRSARPFEYAFLLDALKVEQAQGITIDTARCFFRTERRNYILHDAPGHIEFLKNMATGAARADAALLVIDAEEGIQENSKRHGYMISMLGIRQLAVLVNKLDRVGYRQEEFARLCEEYQAFLSHFNVHPRAYLPISAREGVNIATRSEMTAWYDGPTVLEQVEAFARKEDVSTRPFRMPVQDIYKFTEQHDDRRIVVGTVESGTARVGDEVVFHPSGKRSRIKSIEGFAAPPREEAAAGYATGFTLETQVYVRPGELLCKVDEAPPLVGTRLRVNLFWMGRAPLVVGRTYPLRLGAAAVAARLAEVRQVLDPTELSSVVGKNQVDRHDVAECVLETLRPIAFDRESDFSSTGRLVIVDDYEIAGCGVVLEPAAAGGATLFLPEPTRREFSWERGRVTAEARAARLRHGGKCIILIGPEGAGKRELARRLEEHLFLHGRAAYYLGVGQLFAGRARSSHAGELERDQQITHLGGLARAMTDAGLLFITTLADADDFDLERLARICAPHQLFCVQLGEPTLSRYQPDVLLAAQPAAAGAEAVGLIERALAERNVLLPDYVI